MARTSQDITPAEVTAYQSICKANRIIFTTNQTNPAWFNDSNANADVVANYFQNTWKQDLTESNFQQALPHLRPHLKFWSATAQRADELDQGMSHQERHIFSSWFARQTSLVNATDDQGLENSVALLDYLRSNNREISDANLNLAVGNINSYFKGHRTIYWKPYLQESERRAKAERDAAAAQPARQEKVEMLSEFTLPPHLRAHREMLHRKPDDAPAPRVSSSEWESRANAVTTRSHVENSHINKLFVTEPGTSNIDWEATYQARLRAVELYNQRMAIVRG